MKFTYHSGIYTLETEQILGSNPEPVWHFFSNPANLQKLSPPDLVFTITSAPQNHTYPGQIITYSIRILPLVYFNWVTEITRIHAGYYFIDEQRFGPYAMWHHEHFFETTTKGVLMKDKVTFKMPYGFMGRIIFKLFVRRKLKAIFTFRAKAARALFAK